MKDPFVKWFEQLLKVEISEDTSNSAARNEKGPWHGTITMM